MNRKIQKKYEIRRKRRTGGFVGGLKSRVYGWFLLHTVWWFQDYLVEHLLHDNLDKMIQLDSWTHIFPKTTILDAFILKDFMFHFLFFFSKVMAIS